ncbi:MAG: cbb3-type cytochrome oxidase assembly protein CcoS [Oligoflexia bacterium]|nr:cbb3-type cytochrome oxidase assembly protein CcoS [Oligoflexia bacterium]
MTIFLLITGFAFVLYIVFLLAFVWSIRSGQYKDMDLEGERALWEDPKND